MVFVFVLFLQFSSVAQSCPTLCNPMNRSTPGLPVHHHLPEFTQTHFHRVCDAIQPSHPLLPLLLLPTIFPSIRVFSNESEKEMATHSSTLAWKIPRTEEPGRLQFIGSRRVGHDERLHFHFSLSCIGEGSDGNPLPCSCLENPSDRGA